MYVWGHSYEFENNGNWDLIENFSRLMGSRDDIWYATNIQIVDYITAVKALRFSAGRDMVFNPSCREVCIGVDGKPVSIPGGKCITL